MSARAVSARRCVVYAAGFAAAVVLWLLLGATSASAAEGDAGRVAPDAPAAGKSDAVAVADAESGPAGPLSRTTDRLVGKTVRPTVEKVTEVVREVVRTTPVRVDDGLVEPVVDAVDQRVADAAEIATETVRVVESGASAVSEQLPVTPSAPALPATSGPADDASAETAPVPADDETPTTATRDDRGEGSARQELRRTSSAPVVDVAAPAAPLALVEGGESAASQDRAEASGSTPAAPESPVGAAPSAVATSTSGGGPAPAPAAHLSGSALIAFAVWRVTAPAVQAPASTPADRPGSTPD